MTEKPFDKVIEMQYPVPVALAVSWDAHNERADIITLGWFMRTSLDPPLMAISIGKTRHSHDTISREKEFTLVYPASSQAQDSLFCGSNSGRDHDKFRETGFEPVESNIIEPPLISGACANFECKVISCLETGDHTIFVGKVLASHVSTDSCMSRLYAFRDGILGGLNE